MQLKLVDTLVAHDLDGWIVCVYEDETVTTIRELLANSGVPDATGAEALVAVVSDAVSSKEFVGKPGTTWMLRPLGVLPTARVALVGLGKRAEAASWRVARGVALGARSLRTSGARRIGIASFDCDRAAVSDGVVSGLYDFLKYRTPTEEPPTVEEVFIEGSQELLDDVRRGEVVAEAVNFCRNVNNEPPGVATPSFVATVAMQLADESTTVAVLDEVALAERGMNAILSVGQGSASPPRIVTVHYRGAADDVPVYALVGKGVTFDSGGLSIKPAASMEEMKFDKSGACVVLGVMKAVRDLRLPLNVVGVLGLAENMPDGSAYRPGDIVRAGNGKTIEVLNTDAEGRVVLADALYHAGGFKPVAMLDFATLTGAIVVALGDLCAGVMGTDEPLINELLEASKRSGERIWQLPLWPEYDEKVKSDVADIKNIGERSGGMGMAGAIAGASFLKAFVPEGCRWAHLDIAAVANGKKRAWHAAGATAFGVRLAVEWLRSRIKG